MKFLTALFVAFIFAFSCVAHASPDIEQIISEMTLDEKLGQLFVTGVQGNQLTDENRAVIEKYHPGGFFLGGGRNIVDRSQSSAFTTSLQDVAMNSGAGIPLLLCTDQEGGIGSHVNTLTGGVDTLGNLGLGASPDPADTYTSYAIMAQDLKAYGINMDLAPVLDLLINKANTMNHVRSFGENPDEVAVRGVNAVKGLQDNGVIATIKHYPGKGETAVDSHHHAPINQWDREKLEETIFKPFRASIDAGADAVMPGHEIYTGVDQDNVATVSHEILTKLLKEDMGFEGIAISDSMSMGGVTKEHDEAEACVMAIIAGMDMLLFVSASTEKYEKTIALLKKAIDDGSLPMERVDDAVRRILRVKAKYGLFGDGRLPTPLEEYRVLKKENEEKSLETARHAITIVKDDKGLLPLDRKQGDKYLVISPSAFFTVPMMETPFPIGTTLTSRMKKAAPGITVMEYDRPTIEKDTARAVELAADAEVVIVATLLGYFSDEVTNLVKQVQAVGKPVVVIGLSVPYDLERFPDVDAFVAAYNPRSVSLSAVTEAVFGRFKPQGKLPVSVDF